MSCPEMGVNYNMMTKYLGGKLNHWMTASAPELPLNVQITLWFGCVLTLLYVFRYALFVMTILALVIDMLVIKHCLNFLHQNTFSRL